MRKYLFSLLTCIAGVSLFALPLSNSKECASFQGWEDVSHNWQPSHNYGYQGSAFTFLGSGSFAGTGVGAIPDKTTSGCGDPAGAPLEVTFNVTGMEGDLLNISVNIAMTHTWMGDVRAELFAPNGTSHILFGRTGATTATGCGESANLGGTYNFTDTATSGNWWAISAPLGTSDNMPSGDYRTTAMGPQTSATSSPETSLLTAFSGVADLNGTWTLRFWDYGNGDTGSVTSANLSIETEDETTDPEGCLVTTYGQWPSATFTPACTGGFQNILTNAWAGEYSRVNVVAGTEYVFKSDVATDFLTISNAGATTVYASGTGEVTWTATATEVIRFITHADSSCANENVNRIRAVKCGTPTSFADPTAECFQGDGGLTGFENGYGVISTGIYRVADDFVVEPGVTFSLEEITLNMYSAAAIGNVTINVREDNAGVPGAVVNTVTMAATSSTNVGTAFGLTAYRLIFDLATPFELTEGTYWLEPTTTTTVYWEVTTLGDTGADVHLSADSGTSWVPDDSGFNYNAVFYVAGECSTGPAGCLTATYGLFPSATVTPLCFGVTTIATNAWAGEYTNVQVTAGTEYTFASSVTSDFITIGNTDGTAVITSGTGSLTWTADADQLVRFYMHADEDCTNQNVGRTKTVACGAPYVAEEPEYACFQGDGLASNGPEDGNGINPTSNFRVADDFTVAADEQFTLQYVRMNVLTNSDVNNATLNIREDVAGVPGAVLHTVTMAPTTQTLIGSAFGFRQHELEFVLATPIELTEGVYWLEPTATNTAVGTVYWEVTSTGTDGSVAYNSNTSGAAWVPNSDGLRTVFFVAGECETVAEPEGCLEAENGLYPSATYTPSCSGAQETVTALAWTGEYSNVQVTAGTEYIFSSSIATDFVTIGNADGTVVLASGTGSVSWTADADQVVRFYLHLDDECDWAATGLRSRIVQCGDILPPPANDDCEDAIALSCGDSATGNTTFATDSGGNAAGDVFYTFTGDGTEQLVTVSLCGSSYDTYLRVFSDCTLTNEIAFNDDECDLQSELSFVSNGTSTYVIMVEGFGSNVGEFTINVSCGEVPPPPATCDDQEVLSNNLENGLFFGGATSQSLAVDVIVGDAGFPVYGVDLNVFTDGTTDLNFSANFYTDDAGVPGTLVEAVDASVYSTDFVGNAFGFDVYNYVIAFDSPVNLDANTTYWMQIESDGLAWEATSASLLGSGLVFNNTNVSGWTVDPATELVYKLVCDELGVSDLTSFDFAYYPNPVKDVLNISAKKGVESVSAFNLAGQQVLSNAKVSNGQIDVNALTSGTYVFRVTLEGGQVETFKIIKK